MSVEIALTVSIPADPSDNSRSAGRAVDVIVGVDGQHQVGDLAAALARAVGIDSPHSGLPRIRLAESNRTPRPETPLSALALRDGDVIELHTSTQSLPSIATDAADELPTVGAATVAVEVIGGPDVGRRIELEPGAYAVGYTDGRFWAGPLQRQGASLELSIGDELDVLAIGDENTTAVLNGTRLTETTAVGPADILRLGEHLLVVRTPSNRPARWDGRLGRVEVYRSPGARCDVADVEFSPFGPIPDLPTPRRFGVVTVLAPLILGIAMYLVTRQAMFLMMVALSPLMAIGGVIEDRRSGRSEARQRVRDFETEIAAQADAYRTARDREREALVAALPDGVEVERRAKGRTTDLWGRRSGGDAGVRVRLGVGTCPTSFSVEVDSGGHDSLRAQASEAFQGLGILSDVPIALDLATDPVAALVGNAHAVDGLVASLFTQLAVLYSPEDLLLAAAVGPARPYDWSKWLPHLRPSVRLLGSSHLATDTDAGNRLIGAVQDVVDHRLDTATHESGPAVWPRIVVVLDSALSLERSGVERLTETGPAAGVSIIWLAHDPADIPRSAQAIVTLAWVDGLPVGTLANAGLTVRRSFTPESVTADRALQVASALAPLRDAGAVAASGAVPTTVTLWEALGVDTADPEWIQQQWSRAQRTRLAGRFGWGIDGPVELDLIGDGPHALIGGTSGAGKSELLQAIVAGLASAHPPSHLNFLFIDYKGGASTQVFERLPHTVGTVSNLNPALAMRALRSLGAELNYRMTLLDGKAKDLDDLARIDPKAPPRLVIMVDEFATLAKEIPEFVAGIVDIAQRGRSLGIHLVLATQRPAGSVNDNILANTNVRIALRCLDRADSSAIIDAPDAADIPIERRGRLMLRRGPRHLIEVQAAYGGAPIDTTVVEPIMVGVFNNPADRPRFAPLGAYRAGFGDGDHATGGDQLGGVIAAIEAAGRDLPAQRRPWCEPLDLVIGLDAIRNRFPEAHTAPGHHLIGLADVPERQSQTPCLVDLNTTGGLMVFGSSATGKTQLLRTLAAGAGPSTDVVAFDGGSKGLALLRGLPWVGDIAPIDDIEAVTRLIVALRAEIDARRARGNGDDDRHIMVLVDDWSSLLATIDESSPTGPIWSDRLQQLILDGRAVNVHAVITADRRAAVSTRLQSALGSRLVLHHADRSAYLDYGIGTEMAKSLDLPPGRGIFDDDTMVQVAIIGDDPSAEGQRGSIATIAARCGIETHDGSERRAISSRPLPDRVNHDELNGHDNRDETGAARLEAGCVIGVADVSGAPVRVAFGRSPFVVAGGGGSGRSTALATLATSAQRDGWNVIVAGPSDCGLASAVLPGVRPAFDPASIAELQNELVSRTLVVVDDADRLDDESSLALQALVGRVGFAAAVDTRAMTGFSMSAILEHVRRSRHLLLLQPADAGELMQIAGMRVDLRPGIAMPPGRGVLISDRSPTVIQVAGGHESRPAWESTAMAEIR